MQSVACRYSQGMELSLRACLQTPRRGGLTDVAGLKVGHDTLTTRPTGCTVILAEAGAVAGVDVRGAAPGTRETDLLDPVNTVDRIHALVLAGGSAFGLAASTGVVDWLAARGVGWPAGPARVPIVPSAILFDLWMGDHRIWPDAASGQRACAAASAEQPAEGSVGAGAGATVGKLFGMASAMKGGIGTASMRVGAVTVAALVAVNAVGDVIDPGTGTVVAGARTPGGFELRNTTASLLRGATALGPVSGAATTIGCVATDAVLDKVGCTRLATSAHDGLARTISPVHTAFDGDTIFGLATGASGIRPEGLGVVTLAAAAAQVTAMAVLRAIITAQRVSGPAVPDVPAWADISGQL